MERQRDLPARATAGDRVAFTGLMQKTKAALYRFVRRYVGDDPEAYDLLQDTYAAAWLNIGRYDPAYPFEAWIRTIALNKCRDWSRRRFVRRLVRGSNDLASPEAMAVSDGNPSVDEQLETTRRLSRLNEEIARLPTQLKAPLLLTAIEGRSQKEAASILRVSVKAIETRTARARHKLFEALREPDPGSAEDQ